MPSWETVDSESLTLCSHRGRLSSSPVLCGSNAPIGSIRNQRRLIANVYMHKIPRNRVFFLKDQRPEFHRSPEELAGMIHTATPILFQRGKRRCPVAIFRIIPSFEVRHTFFGKCPSRFHQVSFSSVVTKRVSQSQQVRRHGGPYLAHHLKSVYPRCRRQSEEMVGHLECGRQKIL